MCFHLLQYKICGVYWDTCYTNAIIWWSVWSWHFNEKFIPILRGGKPRHKGGLTCIMQRRQHPMFVKRITQINECWFQIWQKWFLLFSLIINFCFTLIPCEVLLAINLVVPIVRMVSWECFWKFSPIILYLPILTI